MKRKARKRTSRAGRKGEAFYITEFTNASGSVSFRVSGMKDGKQIRKNFGTYEEAIAEKQTLESQVHEIESSAKPRVTRLTDEQLEEAEAGYKRLDGRSMTLAIVNVFPLPVMPSRTWSLLPSLRPRTSASMACG